MKGFSEEKKIRAKISTSPEIKKIHDLKIKALLLQNKGELKKATKIYEILLSTGVSDFRVYLNYGILSDFQKEHEKSISLFKKVIELNPNNQLAHFKVAFILNKLGKHKEALNYSLSALNLDPKIWQSHMLLIQILENLNRINDAIKFANKANKIIGKNHLILANLAKLYSYIGEHKKSEEFYLKSIATNSNDPEILYGYAIQLLSIGEKDKASKILKKIIDKNPNYSIAYFTLSRLLDIKKDIVYLNKIINYNDSLFQDNYNKYNILFAKSYIFHRIKNFKESKKLLEIANELKLIDKPANSSNIIKLSNEIYIKEKNKSKSPVGHNHQTSNIFIVGLPRSGSTLVESILGINKNVFNLGENSIFYNSYLESSSDNFESLSKIYNTKIKDIVKNKKISTNKTLINYIYTPVILNHILNSKIIFTFRNPLDNILSMYRAKFTGNGNEYSSCILSSAKVLLNHLKIMNNYRAIYDNEIFFLNYEKMVTTPEQEIKKLTNWLNWEWDEKFLKPELNNQAFSTASIVEVRSGINNKSIGGWKNYRDLLKPAKDFLEDKVNEIPNYFKDILYFD